MKNTSQKKELPKHPVTLKVYLLRMHNNIPLHILAEFIGVGMERLKKIEKDLEEYNEAHREAIKKLFNIVGLPLTEQECVAFRERLYYLYSLIRDKKMDEAKAIQKELVNIDKLKPCDFEMVILCKLIEIQLLLSEGNYISAEDKHNLLQDDLDMMGYENLFHYNYNKGALYVHQDCYDEGLNFFMKASELMDDKKVLIPNENGYLYYYISMCYSYLGIPYHAISYWQKAKQMYPDNNTTGFILNADRGIALNYIRTNQLKDAERLLNKCQAKSEGLKDNAHIGVTLLFFGHMYKKAENWVAAIKYYDMAIECLPVGTINYSASVYHKIFCVIHTRAFTKAEQLLEQAKDIFKENKVWAVYFEALGHYLKISRSMTSYKNKTSIKYIESIAIPHFTKMHDYFIAMDYYSLLAKHHEKLKSTLKSLRMIKGLNDILKRCFIGDERSA